eukprot:11169714-Lingulodinium_polyedra.AAC.1
MLRVGKASRGSVARTSCIARKKSANALAFMTSMARRTNSRVARRPPRPRCNASPRIKLMSASMSCKSGAPAPL